MNLISIYNLRYFLLTKKNSCKNGFSNGCQRLEDLIICIQDDEKCNSYYGLTIGKLYNLAQNALGGCCKLEVKKYYEIKIEIF